MSLDRRWYKHDWLADAYNHKDLFLVFRLQYHTSILTSSCRFSAGSCTSAEQLGELLHGDPDGDRSLGLHHELHHRQEQEQPPRSGLVQLAQRTVREQLCTSWWVVKCVYPVIYVAYRTTAVYTTAIQINKMSFNREKNGRNLRKSNQNDNMENQYVEIINKL